MDSELLLKFIGCFPDYLSALSCTILRFLDNLCRNSCVSFLVSSQQIFRKKKRANLEKCIMSMS